MIGKLKVSTMTNEQLFEAAVTNITITGSRAYIQISSSYLSRLPFSKNIIYQLDFVGIEGFTEPILAMFEDYTFNASATDYSTEEGQSAVGVCVLSNQLQFMLVG